MKRYLIGLGVLVAGVGIALGVRDDVSGRATTESESAAVESVEDSPAAALAVTGSEGSGTGGSGEPAGAGAEDAGGKNGDATSDMASAGAGAEGRGASAASESAQAGAGQASPSGTQPAAASSPVKGGSSSEPAGAGGGEDAVRVQEPDVETVLRRASAAYEATRSLQADFVQVARNPLLGTTINSRGTLYQRRPDRFLMDFSDPAGDVIVSDGQSIWIYYPSVDEAQVIRAPAGAAGAGGVDLQAQFLGDPVARFDSEMLGREEVDGRPTWVVRMIPRQPMGYRSLKAWVDAEDYLVRRFELVEDNGVTRNIELRNLKLNPSLDDSRFRFTPPEGARVVERG